MEEQSGNRWNTSRRQKHSRPTPKDAFVVLMLVERHEATTAHYATFHTLTGWASPPFFVGVFFLRRIIAAARSAVAPLLIPPARRLLAAAPALMQITGMYEGYFVRCRVETIARKRGGKKVKKKHPYICCSPRPPPPNPKLSGDPSVPPIASEALHTDCASIIKTARVWGREPHCINRRRRYLAK